MAVSTLLQCRAASVTEWTRSMRGKCGSLFTYARPACLTCRQGVMYTCMFQLRGVEDAFESFFAFVPFLLCEVILVPRFLLYSSPQDFAL